MKLQKCPECATYTLKEICPKCGNQTKSAHYKYRGLKTHTRSGHAKII